MKKTHLFLIALSFICLISCKPENNIKYNESEKRERSEIIFHKSHEPSRQETPFSDAVETDDFCF